MRRCGLMVCVLVAGVALGAVGAKLKFPYAGEALNEPCGRTELEWRCAAQSWAAEEPRVITDQFLLVSAAYQAKPKGLLVDLHVTRRPGILLPYASRGWTEALTGAVGHARRTVLRHIGTGSVIGHPFVKGNDLAVRVYLDGQLSMTVIYGQVATVRWPDHERRVPASK